MNNFCSQIVSDAAGWGVWGLAHRVQEVSGKSTLEGMKRHTWFLIKGMKAHHLVLIQMDEKTHLVLILRDESTPLGSWKICSPRNLLTDSGFFT